MHSMCKTFGKTNKKQTHKDLDKIQKKVQISPKRLWGIFFLCPPINQYEVFFLLESGSKTIFYLLLY